MREMEMAVPPLGTAPLGTAPSGTASHDTVGRYNQDEINGFTDDLLDGMLDLVDPASAGDILDAMGGDGNFTLRLFEYCRKRGIAFPRVTLLEFSRVQVEFARVRLAGLPVRIVHGDALAMRSLETGESLEECVFDRVMIKSANHEIPADKQRQLYESVRRVLRPNGFFVNLGFVFDDPRERDEFREITRIKDFGVGMSEAVKNRHFPLREELMTNLRQAGFADARCGKSFAYRIRSSVASKYYFARPELQDAYLDLHAAQARAMTLRRNGRVVFDGEHSVMICPGEITVARRPSWEETNADAFRRCPYDFLRQVEAHARLLDQTVQYIPDGSDVLDLACGPGLLADRLAAKARRYRGIDISPKFIDACRSSKRKPSFRFEIGDVNAADLGGECCDVVAILNTLFLGGIDPIALIRKSREALRSGGRLIVSGPSSPDSFKLAEPLIRKQLERDGLWERFREEFNALEASNASILSSRGNYWSVEGMVALLRELGFRAILADTRIYYGFGYLVVVEK